MMLEILNIPLDNHGEDTWSWKHSSKGLFTVKSYYHMLHKYKYGSVMISEEWKKFWKCLWRLKIPNKIKYFGWRLCSGILPVCDNLLKKGLDLQSKCFLYNNSLESANHVFGLCEKVVPI